MEYGSMLRSVERVSFISLPLSRRSSAAGIKYLTEEMARRRLMQNTLHFASVDEALKA